MSLLRFEASSSFIDRRLTMTIGVFSFFFQAEDCIRDLVRSRGLGDVYKRQVQRIVVKFVVVSVVNLPVIRENII